jgi:hypothetical protein
MKTELLRMLSPDAIDIGKVGGGFAALTPQDIAAALAGLKHGPYYLGMSVYVADPYAYTRLYVEVCGMEGIPKKPADLKGVQPVENILLLCLDELWGNNKCDDCGGTGLTPEQQQCAICRGRKFKLYTELSRSRQAGIPYEYWPKYKGFYQRLYTQLTDWDTQIKTHLTKRLAQ